MDLPPNNPDGSSISKHPDPDGSSISKHPDPDGSLIYTHPDPDGSLIYTHPNGFPISKHPNGYPITTHPNPVGSPISTHPNPVGSPISTHPNPVGYPITTHPNPDGSLIYTHPTPDDSPTSTPPETSHSITTVDLEIGETNSVLEDLSESAVVLDPKAVSYNRTNARKNSSLFRKFRLTSMSSLSGWVTNLNEYVSNRKEENSNIEPDMPVDDSVYLATLEHSINPQTEIQNIERSINRPYVIILKFLGMRSIEGFSPILRVISVVWPVIVFGTIITGYATNFLICEPRHHGNRPSTKEPCLNNTISDIFMESLCDYTWKSLLPSFIHFFAFAYTFWMFRICRSEQVEALIQKCFVTIYYGSNTMGRKGKLIKRLKVYHYGWIISLIVLLSVTIGDTYCGKTLVIWRCSCKKIPNTTNCSENKYESPTFSYREAMEGFGLSIPMFIIHTTYFPILLNFVIQSRLIAFLIDELRETLRDKRTTLKDLMKECHDTSSFLHRMNHEASPAVSMMLLYLAYGLFIDFYIVGATVYNKGGFGNFWFNNKCTDRLQTSNNISNDECDLINELQLYGQVSVVCMIVKHVILLCIMVCIISEACKVNTCFKRLVNQTLETRVYGFKTACFHELDSFHNYIKSLRMRAKIFQYPMETKRVLLPVVIVVYCGLIVQMVLQHYQTTYNTYDL